MATTTLSKNKSSQKTKLMAITGLMAAVICLLTAVFKIPTGQGFTHIGDGAIFLAASILPTPYAIAAAAIGGALADTLSGYLIWAPATIIIKALTASFFTAKNQKIICKRNIIMLVPSLALCIVGYSLYQGTVMTISDGGSVTLAAIGAAFVQTPAYCVQIGLSAAVYILLGVALDKINFKKRVGLN